MMLTNEIKTLKSLTVMARWMILKCRAKTEFFVRASMSSNAMKAKTKSGRLFSSVSTPVSKKVALRG